MTATPGLALGTLPGARSGTSTLAAARLAAVALFSCASWGGLTAAAQPPTAVLGDGTELPAALQLGSDLQAPRWLDEQGGPLEFHSPVVHWGRLWEARDAKWIVLRDGSLLAADLLQLNATDLYYGLDPFAFGALPLWRDGRLPRAAAAGAVLQAPRAPGEFDRLLWRMRQATADDALLLLNGDSISGPLLAPPADEAAAAERTVQVDLGDRSVQTPWSRVQAIRLRGPGPDDPPRPAAWLGFRDGSLVAAERLQRRDNDLTLTLLCGAELQMTTEDFDQRLTYYEPATPRIIDVVRLPVLSYRHLPFLSDSRELPHQRNHNVLGSRLRVGGVWRRQGLGLPTASRIAYDLPAGSRRFVTAAAIDDAAQGRGSAIVKIYLQRDDQWTLAAESETLRGGRPPAVLHADLTAAQRLAILVDYADRGDILDYVNLLSPRILLDAASNQPPTDQDGVSRK